MECKRCHHCVVMVLWRLSLPVQQTLQKLLCRTQHYSLFFRVSPHFVVFDLRLWRACNRQPTPTLKKPSYQRARKKSLLFPCSCFYFASYILVTNHSSERHQDRAVMLICWSRGDSAVFLLNVHCLWNSVVYLIIQLNYSPTLRLSKLHQSYPSA